jgi:hypothetical protein
MLNFMNSRTGLMILRGLHGCASRRWTPTVHTFALVGLSIATVLIGGCGGSGGGSTHLASVPPASPTPPRPLPFTVTVVMISGNGVIDIGTAYRTGRLTAPGQTTQLSAIATLSDGSLRDVTTNAKWWSDKSSVATISQTGLVTAVDFGQTGIFVDLPGATNYTAKNLLFFVLPAETYILTGQCVQDLSRVPNGISECLADARVEIIGGPMSGRATMTGLGGNWEFIGVSGVLHVRVSKEGYITAVQDVPHDAGPLPITGICGPGLAPVEGGSTRVVPLCI